jgi:hypothetical protein
MSSNPRDDRERTRPFSQRTRAAAQDVATALGITVDQVQQLAADGAIRRLANGFFSVESVLQARQNLTRRELEGNL